MDGEANRIDPDRWRALIMSFAQYYGLVDGRVRDSELGRIPEETYPRVGAETARGGVLIELP
ncbi:MAG TPA: hypothetical protein VHX88_00860 [Solirubrobacteraceae bacterium]|jgi:hypothetical protein|nr:hypothetical protein [Solirubrobacteraceae bacterium]